MAGYGSTISTLSTNWKTSIRVVSGKEAVAEQLVRRLQTKLFYDDAEDVDFGLPILGELNANVDTSSLPSRIENELLKDDRVDTVDVVVATTGTQEVSLTIDISVVLLDQAGSFRLIVPVNSSGFDVSELQLVA